MADSEKTKFIELMCKRTKEMGMSAVQVFEKLPQTDEGRIIGRLFLWSVFSVGANYRAACEGRSKSEDFSKLCMSVKEAEEVLSWIEVMTTSEIVTFDIERFKKEAKDLLTILSKARRNSK